MRIDIWRHKCDAEPKQSMDSTASRFVFVRTPVMASHGLENVACDKETHQHQEVYSAQFRTSSLDSWAS